MNNKHLSPSLRFTGFNDTWEQRKLGDCCNIFAGGTPSTAHREYWDGGEINWLPSGIIQDCYIYESDIATKITKKGLDNSSAKMIKSNTALLAMTGATCGKSGYLTCESSANQSVMAFETEEIDSKFLFYSFQNFKDYILKFQAGGAQAGINKDTCQNLVFPFPSKEEQHKISELLYSIDNLITLHQRQYDQLLRIKKAMLRKMLPRPEKTIPEVRFTGFTAAWEQNKLGDITIKIGSGKTPLGGKESYVEEGICLIRSQNVRDDKVDLSDVVYIDEETDNSMSNSRVKSGDVLLNITGASIGRSAVYTGILDANVNQHVCIIRPVKAYDSKFIQLNIASTNGQKQIVASQAGGGREGLNFQQIGKMEFMFPPKEEQEKIGAYFTNLDNLITLHQQKLNALRNLKNAMFRKVFL